MRGWHERDWHQGFRPFPITSDPHLRPRSVGDFFLGRWRINSMGELMMLIVFGLMLTAGGGLALIGLSVDFILYPQQIGNQLRERWPLMLCFLPTVTLAGLSCLSAIIRHFAARRKQLKPESAPRPDKADE